MLKGETKADDSSNKEAAEEKQEEDNDYHRSDEQVGAAAVCALWWASENLNYPRGMFPLFTEKRPSSQEMTRSNVNIFP